MKTFSAIAIALAAAVVAAGPALAQPYDHRDQGGNHGQSANRGWSDHSDWRKGGRVARNDWDRGQRVDYRSHHLRRPARGYEWRQVDGNYVLAAVATGVIASMIMSGHH